MDRGYNFRDTLAYVTDPANTQWSGGSSIVHPDTTYGVQPAGWTSGYGPSGTEGRDLNAGIDARFAGCFTINNNLGEVLRYRVTLDAPGTFDIWVAFGNYNNPAYSYSHHWRIYDTTTLLDTKTAIANNGQQFADANGTNHTSYSNWIANATPIRLTFSTQIFEIRFGDPAALASSSTRLAHLRIASVAASGRTKTLRGPFQGPF